MAIPLYQLDAFAVGPFTGNPASVCHLPDWIPATSLQRIAAENNQAETAFVVKTGDDYAIRWFTPKVEVDLCGHATLAAAWVLFNDEAVSAQEIRFLSPRSGVLWVRREGEDLALDFPADTVTPTAVAGPLREALGSGPIEAYRGKTDYMLVYGQEQQIRDMAPDLQRLAQLSCRGVIVTAPGDACDFVSRFFAPQSGIPEDPVTGSAHTTLTQYWAPRLGKDRLHARQLSARGGALTCRMCRDRVLISGRVVPYMKGELALPLSVLMNVVDSVHEAPRHANA